MLKRHDIVINRLNHKIGYVKSIDNNGLITIKYRKNTNKLPYEEIITQAVFDSYWENLSKKDLKRFDTIEEEVYKYKYSQLKQKYDKKPEKKPVKKIIKIKYLSKDEIDFVINYTKNVAAKYWMGLELVKNRDYKFYLKGKDGVYVSPCPIMLRVYRTQINIYTKRDFINAKNINKYQSDNYYYLHKVLKPSEGYYNLYLPIDCLYKKRLKHIDILFDLVFKNYDPKFIKRYSERSRTNNAQQREIYNTNQSYNQEK